MKDLGFNNGILQPIETSKPEYKGYFGVRKLFWTYLRKLHVPFVDDCCDIVEGSQYSAVRYNTTDAVMEYYDKETKEWTEVPAAV